MIVNDGCSKDAIWNNNLGSHIQVTDYQTVHTNLHRQLTVRLQVRKSGGQTWENRGEEREKAQKVSWKKKKRPRNAEWKQEQISPAHVEHLSPPRRGYRRGRAVAWWEFRGEPVKKGEGWRERESGLWIKILNLSGRSIILFPKITVTYSCPIMLCLASAFCTVMYRLMGSFLAERL